MYHPLIQLFHSLPKKNGMRIKIKSFVGTTVNCVFFYFILKWVIKSFSDFSSLCACSESDSDRYGWQMDCTCLVLFYLTRQSALQCGLSFTHSHNDGGRAAMQGAGLPIGSNSGFSVLLLTVSNCQPWDDPLYFLSHSHPLLSGSPVLTGDCNNNTGIVRPEIFQGIGYSRPSGWYTGLTSITSWITNHGKQQVWKLICSDCTLAHETKIKN